MLVTVLHSYKTVHSNPLKPKLNPKISIVKNMASSPSLSHVAAAYNITNIQMLGDSIMFWINNPHIIGVPTANVFWDVYLCSSGNCFHWCLLFRSVNTGNSFFVDLVLIHGRQVDFRMRAVNVAVNNLPYLGQIHTSMLRILCRAHVVLRNFGQYVSDGHNCQHYVADLAADFGTLQRVIPSSDILVPLMYAIVGVVLRVFLKI